MGFAAYGRRLDEGPEVVRYAFGIDEHDPEAGVLAIPVADPEQWYVDGRTDRPKSASVVAVKAVRERERTGAWPEWASHFA